MDSDWCLFCEKHVKDLGAVYCSKECANNDKLMATSASPFLDSSLSIVSNLAAAPTIGSLSLNFRRSANQTVHAHYDMPWSSALTPTCASNHCGITKSFLSSTSSATATGIRALPLNRDSTRRQALVL
ncbi:hypothetical protein BGZ46_007726 [Entomortierella lignicola]|nr:hypothetical protein BGZ46_007726 [Entomortierella lignicola]